MAPKLRTVATESLGINPPRTLGAHGRALWDSVTRDYRIEDAGGIEMLCAACQACDRAESLREQIDSDGEIIRTKAGPKDHPGLKHELAARSFVVRTLQRLGLDVEALKTVGRPGGTRLGISYDGN
jgi:hypothetical protein